MAHQFEKHDLAVAEAILGKKIEVAKLTPAERSNKDWLDTVLGKENVPNAKRQEINAVIAHLRDRDERWKERALRVVEAPATAVEGADERDVKRRNKSETLLWLRSYLYPKLTTPDPSEE